jgi:acetyl-CoA acetyltransferase
MDGAFALYEAWVKLQIGEVDTALVYSYGKPSAGSIIDVLATQLDPYYVSPLWPDCFSIAALQARLLLDKGLITLEKMAEISMRSQKNGSDNPNAVRSSKDVSFENLMNEPSIVDPLRASDISEIADGGCALILAAGDKAKSFCERPAWIKGIDHRVDSHTLGVRDLTRSPSAFLAAEKAGINTDRLDIAEIHGITSAQELILEKEFDLNEETRVNLSGGSLASDTMMASGLIRISEVASRIISGQVDRGLAHATSGPCLQQNLVCILEGE